MQMRACGISSSRSYSPQPPTSDGEGDMRGGLQIGFFAIVTRPSCSPFDLPEPDGDPDGDQESVRRQVRRHSFGNVSVRE